VYKVDAAGRSKVLHNSTGGADGGDPYGAVILDSNGNLYGTAGLRRTNECRGGIRDQSVVRNNSLFLATVRPASHRDLVLHQVVKGTFTLKLSHMLGTQAKLGAAIATPSWRI
jgi:hypothetical protein